MPSSLLELVLALAIGWPIFLWGLAKSLRGFYGSYRHDMYLRQLPHKPWQPPWCRHRRHTRYCLLLHQGLILCLFSLMPIVGPGTMLWFSWFVSLLLLLSYYDWRFRVLPDPWLIVLAILALLKGLIEGGVAEQCQSLGLCLLWLGGSCCIQRCWRGYYLGAGDYKLLLVLSLWMGFVPLMLVLLVACLLSLIMVLIRYGCGMPGSRSVAFGPWLSFAAVLVWLGQDSVLFFNTS